METYGIQFVQVKKSKEMYDTNTSAKTKLLTLPNVTELKCERQEDSLISLFSENVLPKIRLNIIWRLKKKSLVSRTLNRAKCFFKSTIYISTVGCTPVGDVP